MNRLTRLENHVEDGMNRLTRLEDGMNRFMSLEFRRNGRKTGRELRVHWLPAVRGELPPDRPQIQGDLLGMDRAMCQAIERAYNLASAPTLPAQREAIACHLGIIF